MKQVIFVVGGEEFGIDIFKVEAIEKNLPLINVPNAPSHIGGIVQLRGEAIPVYDLGARFGRQKKTTGVMVITRIRDMKVAVAVDDVSEIVEAGEKEVLDAPTLLHTEQTAFVNKVTNVNGHMFISLDLDNIISAEELKAIEEMLKNTEE